MRDIEYDGEGGFIIISVEVEPRKIPRWLSWVLPWRG